MIETDFTAPDWDSCAGPIETGRLCEACRKENSATDFPKDDLLPQQPIELVFDDLVTFADGRFQLLAVADLDMTARVTDRSGILQASGSLGHAFAAHA